MRLAILTVLPALLIAQPATAAKARPKIGMTVAEAAAVQQLKTIERLDDAAGGPQLNAVIVVNPQAPAEAAKLADSGRLRDARC